MYKPNYDDKDISKHSNRVNVSGRSPQSNLTIEESNQRKVAESEVWMLARKESWDKDSRERLEALGFTVKPSNDELFYDVTPPKGWTKETEGYHTSVYDASGKKRIHQFYKGAWYDRRADLSFEN